MKEIIIFIPKNKVLRFLSDDSGCTTSGIVGPIDCTKGFKVMFTVPLPYPNKHNWTSTKIGLVDQYQAKNCDGDISNLKNEEDPGKRIYGVCYSNNAPCNLKVHRPKSKRLCNTDPITMHYNREAETVCFYSEAFEYFQTGVSKDIKYSVGVGMGSGMEMKVQFLYIE